MAATGQSEVPNGPRNLSEIPGEELAKRAVEVALAGGHHLLLVGPAGSGKTALIQALPGLLPPLDEEEACEVGAIYRRASEPRLDGRCPPIRIPHPASTLRGVLGCGTRPGEVELAHRGVLVLDELPEFRREVLGALRQPMEERVLRIARTGEQGPRPAAVIVLATMRACPCGGFKGHRTGCACSRRRILRYRRRASEPLGYLFDLQSELGTPGSSTTTSAAVRERILETRRLARERFARGRTNPMNAAMTAEDLRRFCPLDPACAALEEAALGALGVTPGIFARVRRVARTVADLAGSEAVRPVDLAEALAYRSLFLEQTDSGVRHGD